MDDMKELIDEQTVERVMLLLGLLGPLVGLVGGVVYGKLRRQPLGRAGLCGLGFGLLGTLVWALWRLFSYLVRYQPAPDPANDYFGLERVDILLLNVVIFVAVGAGVGWLIRFVRDRAGAGRPGAAEPSSEPAVPDGPAAPEAAAEAGGKGPEEGS